MARSCSIVMEYENAGSHDRDDAAPVFAALLRQLLDRPATNERDELILVFDPSTENGDEIDNVIDKAAPGLRNLVDCRKLARPGLRYYELKNAGAEIAGREYWLSSTATASPRTAGSPPFLRLSKTRERSL